ncbi:FAD-dependent oxidoreductase [Streptomyces sp. SID13666]|uniref:NAD(P)/FAD-dependent oxidoreductase n=1 Tax=unclassified Streptomyces TaxID=2593676 RepID=UPI0013C0C2A4|nr:MULTISPECIES: FAD-dependent oxidoreductase [unclassified Streptomyces]MCZ4097440.1 FAD-dependent oxidoreductase [Streptomyces sp. H39-C1]NEA53948.1 FAD-dependent oxidoreductase [Streptomyces sp. SID13666]
MTPPTFVIVGASLAGAKAAEALRGHGFDGRILLIGDEPDRPYERPPLSKGYLQGKQDRDTIFVHPAQWYIDQAIDLRRDTLVTELDRDQRTVTVSGGETIGYDKLLLTTGASPRRLPVPGADLDGVLYLRRVGDCERIQRTFQSASRIVFVGGGWIGLEVAAAAREAGVEVTVLEADELPLLRVLGRQIAPVFADLHREHGVDLRLTAQVAEIVGENGTAAGVRLADGTRIDADAVVVGIGAVPNSQLAVASGLHVDNGITVDASLRTSDPNIHAAGDVGNAFHPMLGKHIRVEHWANALHQPETAARSMLGEAASYDRVPYFFTDQYDLGMEYAGYAEPGDYDDVVVRGDLTSMQFIAFWTAQGRVLAGMNVNIWDVNEAIQHLVRSGTQVDRDRLADPDVPLEELAAG